MPERMVQANGIDVCTETFGDPRDPPILLVMVTRGFEWYVTRGEPVPRNQFGPHPWFSAR